MEFATGKPWRLAAAGWRSSALSSPPLHALSAALFSAHMLQHEVLMLVAAPLLVVSRPLSAGTWALPRAGRRALGRWLRPAWVRRGWRRLTHPLAAWSIQAAALWVWHAPGLFQAALASEGVHTAQHASFFGSALLFWWALAGARQGRVSRIAAVLYVFTTMIHSGALGALLTFSPVLWYPIYAPGALAWGFTPLEDQQLGGLIMWVPGGMVYLIAGLGLCASGMRESQARVSRKEIRRARCPIPSS